MNPLVSIIIPAYNRSDLLGATLESILAQTYIHWECLIIDDGSTDYTLELMEFYSGRDRRIKYIKRPSNLKKGANACRNFGLKLSKGEFIQWFDSDDLMDERKIMNQIRPLAEADIDLAFCEFYLGNSNLTRKVRQVIPDSDEFLLDYLTQNLLINFQNTVFKKKVIEGILLNENLEKSQEVEFFLRLLQIPGLKFKIINEPLAYIRLHDNNITSSFIMGNRKAIRSEMDVKLLALEYIYRSKNEIHLFQFLNLYFKFLCKILDQSFFRLYFRYVIPLFIFLSPRYYWGIIKLIWLGLVTYIYKRRPYRYRNLFYFN